MALPASPSLKRFCHDRCGGVAIGFALSLVVLAGAAGAAIDYSQLSRARASLQRSVDAAALEGAKSLALSVGANTNQREKAAENAARTVMGSLAPTVPADVSAAVADDSVVVRASLDKALIFGAFLGMKVTTVGVASSATYSAGRAACIIALSPTEPNGFEVAGSGTVSAPRCSIWSNATGPGSVMIGPSAKATARRVCAVGGRAGNGSVTPAPETGCAPYPDPFADRAIPTAGACDQNGMSVTSSQTTTLFPGVYCGGLKIDGNVVLNPGLYVIKDGPFAIGGKAKVTGSGVSILLSGNAPLSWTGSGSVSLSAPTSGPLAGIAIASDPNGPEVTSTSHGDISLSLDGSFTGAIYLPRHKLKVTGSSTLRLQGERDKLVARAIEVTGSGTLAVGADDLPELRSTWSALRLSR